MSVATYKLLRAEEDYSYLGGTTPYQKDFFDPIKFIPLNQSHSIFLSFGGEVRPRLEYFANRNWVEGREVYYSQRLALHGGLGLGPVRLFGELYHGLLSLQEKEFTQDDKLDVHQGFIDLSLPVATERLVYARIGRQEITYGIARLVGVREGPNIRRTFDAARAGYSAPKFGTEAFVASEVRPFFGFFDNSRDQEMVFWGLYNRLSVLAIPGGTEVYYLGLDLDEARYEDGTAPETRHTIGVRRFGSIGRSFRYNTELMFQFGSFGKNGITAFGLETDYHYLFLDAPLRPEPGIKLDYISGDRRHGDGKLNTFNPMFANPSYFGLLAQIAPMNLIDIHPSLRLELSNRAELMLEWDFFWRASKEDGLYRPPRFLLRDGREAESSYVGNQPGFEIAYEIDRHAILDAEISYFISGPFIEETGDSPNIFHLAATLSYRF